MDVTLVRTVICQVYRWKKNNKNKKILNLIEYSMLVFCILVLVVVKKALLLVSVQWDQLSDKIAYKWIGNNFHFSRRRDSRLPVRIELFTISFNNFSLILLMNNVISPK